MWSFSDKSEWMVSPDEVHYQLSSIDELRVAKPTELPVQRIVRTRFHPSQGDCPGAKDKALFPGDFENCPNCGINLVQPELSADLLWKPPFGSLESTRTSEHKLKSAESINVRQGEELGLPISSDRFRFLSAKVGAVNRLMFVFDLRDGTISVHNPKLKGGWHELESPLIGVSNMPDLSWTVGISASEKFLLIPDDGGLKRVTADWSSSRLKILDHFSGRCLAGPGVLSEAGPGKPSIETDWFCTPMVGSDGVGLLQLWREDRPDEFESVQLPAIPAEEVFGQPVRPRRRLLIWPGRKGLLRVQLEGASLPSVTWHPWPADSGRTVVGLPQLGPTWRDLDGSVWQFCEERVVTRRGEDITIKRIQIDSLLESSELPSGDVFSTGFASFSRFHDHWRNPGEYVDTEPARMDVRLPLLQFGSTGGTGSEPDLAVIAHLNCTGDVDTLDLSALSSAGKGVRGRVAIEVSGPNSPPVWFAKPGVEDVWWNMDVTAFFQMATCVHDGFIWVGTVQPPRLYRWPIRLS